MYSFLKTNKKDVKEYLKDLRGTQSIPATIGDKDREQKRIPFSPFSQIEEDYGSLVPKPKGPTPENGSQSSGGYRRVQPQSQSQVQPQIQPQMQSQMQQCQMQQQQAPVQKLSPQPIPANAPSNNANPLRGSKAMSISQQEQSYYAPNYQQMSPLMYNPRGSQMKSPMYIPVQSDMSAGMPMMMPYGYPYMPQMPQMQQMQQMQQAQQQMQPIFKAQMLEVSETKEDDDEEVETPVERPQKSLDAGKKEIAQKRKPGKPKKVVDKAKPSESRSDSPKPANNKSVDAIVESPKQEAEMPKNDKPQRVQDRRDVRQKKSTEAVTDRNIQQQEPKAVEPAKKDPSGQFISLIAPVNRNLEYLVCRKKNNLTYAATAKKLESLTSGLDAKRFIDDTSASLSSCVQDITKTKSLRSAHESIMKELQDVHDKVLAFVTP